MYGHLQGAVGGGRRLPGAAALHPQLHSLYPELEVVVVILDIAKLPLQILYC